jgi:hypothetical protein
VPAGEPVALSASADSGLAVSFTSTTPQVCTVSGSTVLTLAADHGPCTITASQNGNATYAPAEAEQSFPVTTGQQPQTVTFTLPPKLVQNGVPVRVPVGQPVALSASASSGLAVSFTSTTPQVCTVSGSTVLTLAAGDRPCTITASQNGNATYAPSEAGQSFPVTTGDKGQTIAFTPQEVKQAVPVGEPVTLSASASSGLPVSFTAFPSRVCTVSGSTVLTLATGGCTITAFQNGSVSYSAVSSQGPAFKVIRAGQTIIFDQPPDAKVGDRVTLVASATSGLPVSFTSTTHVCTVSQSIATAVTAGTCTIIASQRGDDNYLPAREAQSFQVKKGQTITFGQPPDAKIGDQVTLPASATSGLPVSLTSTTPHVCTVSGSPTTTAATATAVAAGTCTIIASQAGDENYVAADNVQHSFQVKKPQTITFDQPKDVKVGDRVTLPASATSGLPVSLTSTTPHVCTVSEATATVVSIATAVAAGTCTIIASQAGNASYAAAHDAQHSFQVTRADQTITFDQPPDAKVGERVTLSASASSRLPVSFTSGTPGVCTVSGSTVTAVAAGPCAITAAQAGDENYAPAKDVQHSFRVTRAPRQSQTIDFPQPADTTAKQQVTLSASATSGLPVSFASTTLAVCTVAGSTVTTVIPGTCTITASQAGDDRYARAPDAQHSFQVGPGTNPQTIDFAQPPDTAAGQQVTLSASASSGLPVSFTSTSPSVCAVSGSTITTATTGICTITASQSGNATYGAATSVQHSFQVGPGKATQTIDFAQPPDTAAGQRVALSASASSGLPVSFTSTPPSVCAVSGSTVTTATTGTCTITASQDGSDSYAAAPQVHHSFQVTPPARKSQTITFASPPSTTVGGPVALSASASSGLAVSFTSGTPGVCTVSGSTVTTATTGTCMITASQGGSASYAAADDVTQSFQVNPAVQVNPPGQKPQTITFNEPPEATAGVPVGEPVTLSASTSSGLPVSFTSGTPPVCTVSGSTVTTVAVGACMITASQGGSASYAAADDVTQSFQVNPVSSKGPGALVFLLAAATMAAAGISLAVRRLRLRSRQSLTHAPDVQTEPDPGPPGQVTVRNTGTAATHTVRIEPNPGASTTTIEEVRP